MPRKRPQDEYIPIKIGGWNGKFVVDKQQTAPTNGGNRLNTHQAQQSSSAQNFYGFDTAPTILPTVWDGTFGKSGETYTVPERNRSAENDYFAYTNEPEILPPTWSGEFVLDPNDVRIKPERNQSDSRDLHDVRNHTIILPPKWDGTFDKRESN